MASIYSALDSNVRQVRLLRPTGFEAPAAKDFLSRGANVYEEDGSFHVRERGDAEYQTNPFDYAEIVTLLEDERTSRQRVRNPTTTRVEGIDPMGLLASLEAAKKAHEESIELGQRDRRRNEDNRSFEAHKKARRSRNFRNVMKKMMGRKPQAVQQEDNGGEWIALRSMGRGEGTGRDDGSNNTGRARRRQRGVRNDIEDW